MFPSLTQSLDMRSQSSLATLDPMPGGPSCVTRQAGVSAIIFHHPLPAGGREKSETAIMLGFIPNRSGGPRRTRPRTTNCACKWGQGTRMQISAQVVKKRLGQAGDVQRTCSPYTFFLWPELISIAVLCLHIMLALRKQTTESHYQCQLWSQTN